MSVKDVHLGNAAGDNKNDPPMEEAGFTAQVIILNPPGQNRAGHAPALTCLRAHIACKFAELKDVDYCLQRGWSIAQSFLKPGDSTITAVVSGEPMCVENFADCPPLGHFAVLDMRQTVVGVIK